MKRISKKRLKEELARYNIYILRRPSKPTLENIVKVIQKAGFSVPESSMRKLRSFISLIRKYGLYEIRVHAEDWRKPPEVHLETERGETETSYYEIWLPVHKKR
jgi:hypothetical protein